MYVRRDAGTGFPPSDNRVLWWISERCIRDMGFRIIRWSFGLRELRVELICSKCIPLQDLRSSATRLEDTLGRLPRENKSDALFSIAFDEAANLMGEEVTNDRLAPLQHIISAISSHKIWYFFLSTNPALTNVPQPEGATGLRDEHKSQSDLSKRSRRSPRKHPVS